MEFQTKIYSMIGGLGLLFWSINYYHYFNSNKLPLPFKSVKPPFYFAMIKFFFYILGLISWGLLVFSLSGPVKRTGLSQDAVEVSDIYFVIDTSRSMLADDFSPNRMEVAKNKLREFIKMEPSDRIGIVTFSEQIYTLLPLTIDLKLAHEIVNQINVGELGNGTNIGDALALAVARLKNTNVKSKTIILLTDGVSQVDSLTPYEAAILAKNFGIKIYTIAVGSDEDARIPIGNINLPSSYIRYQKIPGGSIDLKTLRKIAEMTSGKFYKVADEKSLKEVFLEIQELEKSKISRNSSGIYREFSYPYLFTGVLLLLIVELIRKIVFREVI